MKNIENLPQNWNTNNDKDHDQIFYVFDTERGEIYQFTHEHYFIWFDSKKFHKSIPLTTLTPVVTRISKINISVASWVKSTSFVMTISFTNVCKPKLMSNHYRTNCLWLCSIQRIPSIKENVFVQKVSQVLLSEDPCQTWEHLRGPPFFKFLSASRSQEKGISINLLVKFGCNICLPVCLLFLVSFSGAVIVHLFLHSWDNYDPNANVMLGT